MTVPLATEPWLEANGVAVGPGDTISLEITFDGAFPAEIMVKAFTPGETLMVKYNGEDKLFTVHSVHPDRAQLVHHVPTNPGDFTPKRGAPKGDKDTVWPGGVQEDDTGYFTYTAQGNKVRVQICIWCGQHHPKPYSTARRVDRTMIEAMNLKKEAWECVNERTCEHRVARGGGKHQ